MIPGCTIARYHPETDDIEELTSLLHRAYAPLLAAGMNYLAATQSPDLTEKRLASSDAAWIARHDGRMIGTVCYYSRVTHTGRPQWYSLDGVGVFAQFAVEPSFQKRNVGYQLLNAVERNARDENKAELACDTAEPAQELRRYYARRGFREVGVHRWPHAPYDSVILSKTLNGATHDG